MLYSVLFNFGHIRRWDGSRNQEGQLTLQREVFRFSYEAIRDKPVMYILLTKGQGCTGRKLARSWQCRIKCSEVHTRKTWGPRFSQYDSALACSIRDLLHDVILWDHLGQCPVQYWDSLRPTIEWWLDFRCWLSDLGCVIIICKSEEVHFLLLLID